MGYFTLSKFVFLLFIVGLSSIGYGQNSTQATRIILVTGATGTQGGAVARELLSRGYKVRGLTRNPNSESSLKLTALGIQMVQGNFDDSGSLDAALEGAYGAFSVQQYRGVGVEGEIRQSRAFADAAKRAGVEHFIYTSVLYARLGTGVPQFESKRQIEDYVRVSGVPYSIVRPPSFMSNLEAAWEAAANEGIYSAVFPASMARHHIAPEDIGRIVADAFDNKEVWIGRELDIAGQQISYDDIAIAMSRQIGKPVVYEQIPWEEYISTATSTAIARDAWYLANPVQVDMNALEQEFPGLRTIEDYLISAGWSER
ncbi:MAG: NmrA family protein [Rhodospirillaceae bacterium]|nr:NmrA family protein [Rhodospirillaceae bacterium]|tara:strand:- start:13077 stop:14018 length:942 start_codon:yes stop_codon:yes gene_type:complete